MFYKTHPDLKKKRKFEFKNKQRLLTLKDLRLNRTQDLARERARKLIKERRASLLLRSVFLIFIGISCQRIFGNLKSRQAYP